jgi:transcriptional regulator with XRE-family HTH domain
VNAKRPLHRKEELSQSIKTLRENMNLTQPEFASRLGIAIRTVARWEKDQPPHGEILTRLAQIADARDLNEIAGCFVAELRTEKTGHYASTEPELKAWVEGVEIAFRLRYSKAVTEKWFQIARNVMEIVESAARGEEKAGDQKMQEFSDLHRQLGRFLDEYGGMRSI